jgi:hypothetical protein
MYSSNPVLNAFTLSNFLPQKNLVFKVPKKFSNTALSKQLPFPTYFAPILALLSCVVVGGISFLTVSYLVKLATMFQFGIKK